VMFGYPSHTGIRINVHFRVLTMRIRWTYRFWRYARGSSGYSVHGDGKKGYEFIIMGND